MTVKELIRQSESIRSQIEAHKKIALLIEEHKNLTKKQTEDFIKSVTPQKGVHYFDGEKGEKGDRGEKGEMGEKGGVGITGPKGERGFSGQNGKDGKNVTPKEARLIIMEALKEMNIKDFGGVDESTVAGFISSFEKKSGKSLEKRLNALQDAVMRNYGGHGGSSATSVFNEVATGSGTAFTLANVPKSGTVTLYALGQRLTPTTDYAISGSNIITVNTWLSGNLLADYQH